MSDTYRGVFYTSVDTNKYEVLTARESAREFQAQDRPTFSMVVEIG